MGQLIAASLDTALKARRPPTGEIVHADHGVQFTSWALTHYIRSSGLMPSFETMGDWYDNSMMLSAQRPRDWQG